MTDAHLSALAFALEARGQLARSQPPTPGGLSDPVIDAIRYDSRRVETGDLFVARPGQHADGHDHAVDAVSAGAAAVVAERPIGGLDVPQLIVADAKAALATASAWREGQPSHQLGVVGITGTDGKTTTAYLVRAILEAAGDRCGMITTTDVIVGGRSLGNAARATTPEAPELQGYLREMQEADDRWAVIESTSHGLAQQRVAAIAYDVAVLTNISAEHLEFHGTLEAYRAAKRSLFERLGVGLDNPEKGYGKYAIVNADDDQAESFARAADAAGARVLRYGLAPPLGDRPPGSLDLAATDLAEDPSGMQIAIRTPAWQGTVGLRLAGHFNVHNALAALAVAEALGIDLDQAATALASVAAVPGRMQRVDLGQPFTLVIDYAHTAESLAKVLDELFPSDDAAGLIAVFGSAGERDTQKRAAMGRVAGERCKLVVVTDEDPRREDRHAILDAIARGAESSGKRRGHDLLLIPDRDEAITAAIASARAGDAVLLAGKGHEKTIEMADGDRPWDEEAAARAALRSLGFS